MTKSSGTILAGECRQRLLDPPGLILLGVLAALGIFVPLLSLAVPESSALHVTTYTVALIGKYLTYAMLALADRKSHV